MERIETFAEDETRSSSESAQRETSSAEPGSTESCKAVAAGLFGHSIRYDSMQSFAPMDGYIRELEQLPNFTPPSVDRFVAQYVRSNIGITESSS